MKSLSMETLSVSNDEFADARSQLSFDQGKLIQHFTLCNDVIFFMQTSLWGNSNRLVSWHFKTDSRIFKSLILRPVSQMQLSHWSIWISNFKTWIFVLEQEHHSYFVLTVILPTPKVISICHQYRARPGCTSVQSDQTLYCWLTNFKFSSWYP